MEDDTKFRFTDPFLLNIWLGYVFWSLLLELISSVYYLNLATLAINGSISLLFFIFLPAFLGFTRIRDFMMKHYNKLTLCSIIGMLGYHFTSSELRAVLIGLSFGIIYMTTVFKWKLNIPKGDRARETSWPTFIGLILLNAFKWAGMSQNPIWINWYFALCASVIT